MSLSREIIAGDMTNLHRRLELGANPNEYDPYGYNPLIMAIMLANEEGFHTLIDSGADINQTDIYGQSPLQWAIKCENMSLVKALCHKKALIQPTTMEQEPLLVLPLLRKNHELIALLKQHGCKADPAHDYILQKSLGHFFELFGLGLYLNHNNVVTLFEYQGFRLDFAIYQLCDYWQQYVKEAHWITPVLQASLSMRQLKSFLRHKQNEHIAPFISDINFFPIGFEGHALSICQSKNFLVIIDRSHGEQQPIEIYSLGEPMTLAIFQEVLFGRKNPNFIKDLLYTMKAKHHHSLWVERQVIGNCTWANLEVAPMILNALDRLESGKKYTQRELDEDFNHWSSWSRKFIFKNALLQASQLRGDRQRLLTYTLAHILVNSALDQELHDSFQNFLEKADLKKFCQIIFENYGRQDSMKDKVKSLIKNILPSL